MNSRDYVNVIIERTLGRGSWEQIRWLFDRYDRPIISQWVQWHGYRRIPNHIATPFVASGYIALIMLRSRSNAFVKLRNQLAAVG